MTGITDDDLVLVTRTRHGLQTETFKGRLVMVLEIMNNGALGGGNSYGDDHHKAALDAIEAQVAEVRKNIENHNNDES